MKAKLYVDNKKTHIVEVKHKQKSCFIEMAFVYEVPNFSAHLPPFANGRSGFIACKKRIYGFLALRWAYHLDK